MLLLPLLVRMMYIFDVYCLCESLVFDGDPVQGILTTNVDANGDGNQKRTKREIHVRAAKRSTHSFMQTSDKFSHTASDSRVVIQD